MPQKRSPLFKEKWDEKKFEIGKFLDFAKQKFPLRNKPTKKLLAENPQNQKNNEGDKSRQRERERADPQKIQKPQESKKLFVWKPEQWFSFRNAIWFETTLKWIFVWLLNNFYY